MCFQIAFLGGSILRALIARVSFFSTMYFHVLPQIADSAQTEYTTLLSHVCVSVGHRRDISSFHDDLIV